jgi:hypothetical protein
MKRVKLPKRKVQVGDKSYSAEAAIREIVMTRPGWRKSGNVNLALSVDDKLDRPGDKLFTDMEHDALVREASMQDSGGIAPPEMNRFHLEILKSFYDAEDVVEDPETRQAAE